MQLVLLAGGLGTRLSEETTIRPKPMVEIGGMPVLWHIMKIYSAHGINDFIVASGYKGHMIKEYFSTYYMRMADVTFDVGKSDLRPEAREKLARLSGILATHPELQLEVEGHTDNTGSAQLNQTLSDQRAQSVARYLVDQGVSGRTVKAQGLGDSHPVADNGTADGRQKNRRVEIIVSGEAIGRTVAP